MVEILVSNRDIMKKALKEKNVKFLCKWFFKVELAPSQEEIVRCIAFGEKKRISISAMTRYGKSFCISVAVALYFLINKGKSVVFIAPTQEQSLVLRNYLAELIMTCPSLLDIVDNSATGDDKLRAQASKSHQTFKNGCSYRVFTAHGDAENLMGHGVKDGMLIIDEACLVSDVAYSKIMRMLGDNPDSNVLVESYNPWTRSGKAFEHSCSSDFYNIHIPWSVAVKEGRTSEWFVESQRKELTPLEFTVLYDSEFPMQSEDSIFDLEKINRSYGDGDERDFVERIISCDVSDKGLDLTVIIDGYRTSDGSYVVKDIYSEGKSENVGVAGRIINMVGEADNVKTTINIDSIGIGTGVVSMVKEALDSDRWVTINGCHFGTSPSIQPERFLNKKAENYFRLAELFEEGLIVMPEHKKLVDELVSMKWDFSSSSRIKIVDPSKSPDFADALVYFVWMEQDNNVVIYEPYLGTAGGGIKYG